MTCGQRARQGPLSLLLADRSRRFLQLLLRFLEAQDKMAVEVVGMASGGAAALVTAVVRRPQLIVTDLDMPDLSGWGLLSGLRRELPEAGIIILTLLSPKIYRATALRVGADELVIKTNLESDLLPAIQRMGLRFSSGQPRWESGAAGCDGSTGSGAPWDISQSYERADRCSPTASCSRGQQDNCLDLATVARVLSASQAEL